jgi:nucleotide-binding universal stress UspA family protein
MSTKIVYATDYAPGSKEVLKLATRLARAEEATLLIAHVTLLEKYPVGELFDEEPPRDPKEWDKLRSVIPPDPGVPFEHRLLYGEPGTADVTRPADEIMKLAKEEDVEMIVVGTHGRSGLGRLMGSVAETLIRHAPCAVVSVKLPEHAEETVE